ncbi:MAG: ABC transporter permease subunit [Chloroflexi bacterium]|nr:ABC transporter permease subunit [Chloroflexota bacterium]
MAVDAAGLRPLARRAGQRAFGWLANPLAGKELLARMRGPRTYVIAMLELIPLAAIAAGLYLMVANASAADSTSSAPIGRLFFAAITAVELGLICLLAPALTADLISGERERQTLDLLLVTPLSRRQIVIGKLVAALGSLLLLIVLALPIQAVAVLIGGVGLEELALGQMILLLTATTYGCVGLYWSARLHTTRAAMLFSYVTMLLGTGGLPLLIVLLAIADGLFGLDMDETIWPLVWLINGAESTTRRMVGDGQSVDAALLHAEAGLGQLLAASNPLIAGITSAAGQIAGRPLVAFEQVAGVELLYVAPWLVFAVLHLLAALVLIWQTSRVLRRASA